METKICPQNRHRGLLAAILLSEPKARQTFNRLVELGAINFYPGIFYYRHKAEHQTFPLDTAAVDPTCWTAFNYDAKLKWAMYRRSDGEWACYIVERIF